MAEIETKRADIRELRGLHLWHSGLSSCSQRVRFLLEEKGVSWEGHLVNLFEFEHARAPYQEINPKGLVPTLVHDGRTYVESNDILVYIDKTFGNPDFTQSEKMAETLDMLSRSASILLFIRTLSHELLFYKRRMTPEVLDDLARTYQNSEFLSFLRLFSKEGFDDERLMECLQGIVSQFKLLDKKLQSASWIMGENFSIVDMSWAVSAHRLSLMRFPLDIFPAIAAWYRRLQGRPAFERALVAFEGEFKQPEYDALQRAAGLFGRLRRDIEGSKGKHNQHPTIN